MSDEEAGSLRLVSNRSDREATAGRIQEELRWMLREHAANLMRVVRGAGKPHEIGIQCIRLARKFDNYLDAAGQHPSSWDITDMLRLDRDNEERHGRADRDIEWDFAQRRMVSGALQHAASELLGQNTQMAAGRTEMFDGLQTIERLREENRRAYAPRSATKPKRAAGAQRAKPAPRGKPRPKS